eukprot:103335-Amphidinium_carterae.3
MNKDESKFTLTLVRTATGQDAITQERAHVEQSHHAGEYHCYTSAEHNPRLNFHLQQVDLDSTRRQNMYNSIALPLHPKHCTTGTTDHHKDSNSTQSSKCLDETSTSSNNPITF